MKSSQIVLFIGAIVFFQRLLKRPWACLVIAAIVGICCIQERASALPVNVVLDGNSTVSATQSSDPFGLPPENAIDGFITNFSHTGTDAVRWWKGDLGADYDLTHIQIMNSAFNVPSRLDNAVVKVLSSGGDPVNDVIWQSDPITDGLTTLSYVFDNSGSGFTGAHYIYIEDSDAAAGNNYLVLGEVRAFTDDGATYGNLSRLKTASYSQSSRYTFYTGSPYYAMADDAAWGSQNLADANISDDRFAHTDTGDLNPEFEIDLGGTYHMDEINLITRADGASSGYYNMTFKVLDAIGNEVYNSGVIEPWDGDGNVTSYPASTPISPTLPVGGVEGSKVVVTKNGFSGSEHFVINELQIMGDTELLPSPAFKLTIDRETGGMVLRNDSGSDAGIVGYSITSAFGALNQDDWTTITGNYDSDGNGSIDSNDTWVVLSNPDSHTDLSESQLSVPAGDGGILENNVGYDLGTPWIQNPTEDVEMDLLLASGLITKVKIVWTGNDDMGFEIGDLDFNGSIGPEDWAIFKSNAYSDLTGKSPAEAYQAGDLNDDGVNDLADFRLFVTIYEENNGAGSFAAMLQSVPEPATSLMLLMGTLMLSVIFKRRHIFSQFLLVLLAGTLLIAGNDVASAVTLPGSETNFAPGTDANQSSTYGDFTPDAAVDGNYNGDLNYYFASGNTYIPFSHTNDTNGTDPWWQTTLGANQSIDQIILYNRMDGVLGRLSDVTIDIFADGDDPDVDTPLLTSPLLNPSDDLNGPSSLAWDVSAANGNSPLSGGLVRVNSTSSATDGGFLTLAEVDVLADDGIEVRPNVAVGKLAYQSSTDDGNLASRAIDGIRDGRLVHGSVSQTSTAGSGAEYLEVDLGSTHELDAVSLWSRLDGSVQGYSFLSDVQLEIFDANHSSVYTSAVLNPNGYTNGVAPKVISENLLGENISAQYVRVSSTSSDVALGLAEVEVFGEGPEMSLAVNTMTGAVMIRNPVLGDFNLNSYVIESAGGALDNDGWDSIEENGQEGLPQGNGSGNGWEEIGGTPDKALGEYYLLGGSVFSSISSVHLGTAFDPSVFGLAQEGDLVFTYQTVNGVELNGSVDYVVGGDFDGDGDLDDVDVSLFVQALVNRQAYEAAYPEIDADFVGDFDGNGILDTGDINGFSTAVMNAGSGSLQTTVPEPTACLLFSLALAFHLAAWRRWSCKAE